MGPRATLLDGESQPAEAGYTSGPTDSPSWASSSRLLVWCSTGDTEDPSAKYSTLEKSCMEIFRPGLYNQGLVLEHSIWDPWLDTPTGFVELLTLVIPPPDGSSNLTRLLEA